MFMPRFPDQEKMRNKSLHLKTDDSGELDVFEAAKYFSGYNDATIGNQVIPFPRKVTIDDRQQVLRGKRTSLDLSTKNKNTQSHAVIEHKQVKDSSTKNNNMQSRAVIEHKQVINEIKYKQPSSPGGKLATFLNSLFNQTALKKKKTKPTAATNSMKDHEEDQNIPVCGSGGSRKRGSSISDFRLSTTTNASITMTTTNDSKSFYSTSSSGFGSPPRDANIQPRTSRNHKTRYSELAPKQPDNLTKSNSNGQVKPIVSLHKKVLIDKTTSISLPVCDDKYKLGNEFLNKTRKLGYENSDKNRIWVSRYPSKEKDISRFTKEADYDDDGAESDSSSDLFELKNYDLGCCKSSGNLPVYETTNN